MDRAELLRDLARDSNAFAGACELAGLDARVPSCPAWTTGDLVWHLLEVHHFWRTIVEGRVHTPEVVPELERPAVDELLPAYRLGADHLLRALAAADASDVVWTWSTDHTVGFVLRRMAHETAVHRWDADQLSGRPLAIAAELASDGIDEFLHHFAPRTTRDSMPVGGSVHLHCTDVPGEWTVREDGDTLVVTREHAKGDAALRGPASDLLLVLWRRVPLDAIDIVGDEQVARRFVDHTLLD